jgi:transcriptional regulator with XRE-family HTH domain
MAKPKLVKNWFREKQEAQEKRQALFKHAFGERVKELRMAQGWNQDEFAIQALLHRAHPSKIERGELDVRISTILNIADAFSLTVPELLDFELTEVKD